MTIRAILIDAGGVLYLNKDGIGYLNQPFLDFVKANKGKYSFGVISATVYDLDEILRKSGIRDLFDIVLTTTNTNLDKDHPAIHEKALDLITVKLEETIFINNDSDS